MAQYRDLHIPFRLDGFSSRAAPCRRTIRPMTVAVAVVCESKQSGVLTADMSLAVAGKIHVERKCRKIVPLGEQVLVAWAGDKAQADCIIQRLCVSEKDLAAAGAPAVAERVAVECAALQAELHQRLTPQLKALLSACAAAPDPHASTGGSPLGSIAQIVADCTVTADFLVLGRDLAGSMRLFTVEGMSKLVACHDEVAFAAIGSGDLPALVALLAHFPPDGADLPTAVNAAYLAKKLGEMGMGVGEETDMAVLKRGQRAIFLTPEAIRSFESMRQKARPATPPLQDLAAINSIVMGHFAASGQAAK